jgi:riboflavin kinase / FMN adenylyltransferase
MAAILEQRDASPLPPGTAACLGAFDGLHLGHQALLRQAASRAPRIALVTFDPHPLQVVAPDRAPELLHSPALRRRVAAELGVSHLILLPFDAAMAAMPAETFVERVLVQGLAPAVVVVGEDFRFGRGRTGSAPMLAEALAPAGIEVAIVAPIALAGEHEKLGATRIRDAVKAGDVAAAGRMLGRWHAISGTVVRGQARGRTIGFATANVRPDPGLLPPGGVYATVLTVRSAGVPEQGTALASVANLGTNPTFSHGEHAPARTLEVHVLDRDLGERLYGAEVEVGFVERLRDEQRFSGVEELVAQIRRDADAARATLDEGALAHAVARCVR